MRASRVVVVTVAASLTLALGPAVATAAPPGRSTPSGAVSVAGTAPSWLGRATRVAATAPATPAVTSVRVYLAPRGGSAALEAFVGAVSTPGSPLYAHWLTTAAFHARYDATQAAVDRVASHLRAHGLVVTGVEAHHRWVAASGTTAALDAAFGVTLAVFRHDGQTVTAPDRAVTLPAPVAADVLTVVGLDSTSDLRHSDAVQAPASAVSVDVTRPSGIGDPPPANVTARPCSVNYGTLSARYQADFTTRLPAYGGRTLPYSVCGYHGPQLRAAYTPGVSRTGRGATIAIVDAYRSPTMASDADHYATLNGDGAYGTGQFTESQLPAGQYHGANVCDAASWAVEEAIDVEAVHAIAPGAAIRYYPAASCFGRDLTDADARVLDEGVATVVSNSWGDIGEGLTAGTVTADQQVFLQAAASGVPVLFSSGDNGDELALTGIRQPDYPATSPYVTAVGGTTTAVDLLRFPPAFTGQTGWGGDVLYLSADGRRWDDLGFYGGSGGGYSSLFERPAWQRAAVPTTAPPGRAVPDVAMDADPSTGLAVGQTLTFPDGVRYGETKWGGTSLAAPLFAGMLALAAARHPTVGFGQLGPLLYGRWHSRLDDVTPDPTLVGNVFAAYDNSVDPTGGVSYGILTFDRDGTLATASGWDPVTGLGSPDVTFVGGPPASPAGT